MWIDGAVWGCMCRSLCVLFVSAYVYAEGMYEV